MKAINDRRGLTLVELLVVIAIIALLLGILLPGLFGGGESARTVKCQAQQGQIARSVMIYMSEQFQLPLMPINIEAYAAVLDMADVPVWTCPSEPRAGYFYKPGEMLEDGEISAPAFPMRRATNVYERQPWRLLLRDAADGPHSHKTAAVHLDGSAVLWTPAKVEENWNAPER